MNDNLDDMAYKFDFSRWSSRDLFILAMSGILQTSPDYTHQTTANLALTVLMSKVFVGDPAEISDETAPLFVNDFMEALTKWNEDGCPGMQRASSLGLW